MQITEDRLDFEIEGFDDLKRCKKCILPETFPGISFDEEGTCNYCLGYRKVVVKGKEALQQVLARYKGKGEKYDCLVPISGGRDSAFVLHQITKKYRMRVLALTVDSGAIMPEGYRNIEQITKALSVDHVWLRDEKHIKTAQENTKIKFHAWLKKPSINTIVPVLNAGDKQMNLRMFRYAHEHRIPLVLGGNNIGNSTFEQEHFKTGFMGVFPNERGMYSTADRFKLSFMFAWEFLKNRHNYHWSVMREYAGGAFVYFFENLQKPDDVDKLGFYDYIYWNEKEVVPTILNELGWKGASDTPATWRVDDSAYPLIDYMYLKLVGFNEFDEFYSKLIREGQISGKEALDRCMAEHAPRTPSLMRTFEELDVTKEQVDEVLEKYRIELLPRILKRKM
jgi:glucosamine--fructose-6-phosphate aminotransferase (isomerizing)